MLTLAIFLVSLSAMMGQVEKIPFSVYMSGEYCAIEKPSTRIITTQDAFEKYWHELYRNHEPIPEVPKNINWSKEMLIAIHLGTRRSGGYAVKVVSVLRKSRDEIIVYYAEKKPRKDEIVTMALTQPFTVIKTPILSGKIKFELVKSKK
ncbi:MAG TPA: protease complex subunit PrcB family protein [Fimbriimonadales bacterium]|nr:protease complex subunit PrcB family protein [Fimbriimonadales bacterium]